MELISGEARGLALPLAMRVQGPQGQAIWEKPGRSIVIALGLLALALGLVLLAFVFFGDSGERRVTEVRVAGNHYLSREEVLLLSGLEGLSVLTGKDRRLAKGRLEAHGAVTSAQLAFADDGALVVTLSERKCAAQVRDAASGRLYDIDATLAVLGSGEVRCRNVPIVSGAFRADVGRFEDPRLAAVMASLARIAEAYPELLARISEVRSRRDGTTDFHLVGSRLRIVMAGRFESDSVHRLFAAVAYLEQENLRKGTLDLRGRDAVFSP